MNCRYQLFIPDSRAVLARYYSIKQCQSPNLPKKPEVTFFVIKQLDECCKIQDKSILWFVKGFPSSTTKVLESVMCVCLMSVDAVTVDQ